MSKIIQLDQHLTNMIAAGEVVERPSGIIKELIENSIDANATQIEIVTKNGGLDLIGVIDNGEGMDKEDLKQAFKRHSTSKISHPDDLSRIRTLGFRGEALPSIASVSKVNAISNQHELTVDNSIFSEIIASPSNQGTSIWVSELFYKTPARLKHLKSPQYENVRNLGLVQDLALGYPSIAFTFINDEQTYLKTSGKGDLKEVFYQIYGAQYANQSVLFSDESYDFKISGLYVLPHHHRANRYQIKLFLNHRLIRYHQISQTLIREFRRYMPSDRFPMVVLNIESDAQLVDVNVHPNKLEVRLSKEQELLMLIEKTIHSSLKESMRSKDITRSVFEKPMTISFLDEDYSFEKEVETTNQVNEPTEIIYQEPVEVEPTFYQPIRVIGQHHGSYILAQDESSLYIFDQHASMERIRFERVSQQLKESTFNQQQLLLPLIFENRLKEIEDPQAYFDRLSEFGIILEAFSDKDIILRSVPQWLNKLDPFIYINLLLDDHHQDLVSINHKRLATIACHQSIRFNESYSNLQLQKIIDDLLKCEQPYHCPHGRPTFIKADAKDLLKEFSR